MNYRHGFHAGNFADVHKHIVLIAVLLKLHQKPTPLFYLDTHAGRGLYDLQGAEAQRGAEWRSGVARLFEQPVDLSLLERYKQIITSFNAAVSDTTLRWYPGSPLIAGALARDSDRCVFVEQQAEEAAALTHAVLRKRRASVLCEDGYANLKGQLPPKENRGLVFIDPPYENAREFAQLRDALTMSLQRWPNGVYCAWYPITADAAARRFHSELRATGVKKILALELTVRPADSPLGLNGSGVVIVNPPWQLDIEMREVLPVLQTLLAQQNGGRWRVEWIAPE